MVEAEVEGVAFAADRVVEREDGGAGGCGFLGCVVGTVVGDDEDVYLGGALVDEAAHTLGDQGLLVVGGHDDGQGEAFRSWRVRLAKGKGAGDRKDEQLRKQRQGREAEQQTGSGEQHVESGKHDRDSLSVKQRSCC